MLGGFLGSFGVQGVLIVATLVVSGLSYRSQSRAAVREAIEQIDPRHMQYRIFRPNHHRNRKRDIQAVPQVTGYNFLRGPTSIAFYFNDINSREARVVGFSVPAIQLTLIERDHDEGEPIPLNERILKHPKVTSVSRGEQSVVITCTTSDPVACREATTHTLDEMERSNRNSVLYDDYYL